MSNPRCPAVAGAIRSKPLRPALVLLLLLPCLAGAAEPLTLDEALAVAEREAPSLVAAEAAERGASSLVAASESLPDPELLVGLDNVPVTGPDAGSLTDDFMTMRRVGIMQSFPRRAKRQARGERARAELAREAAELAVERTRVREQVALAWFELGFAERKRDGIAALVSLVDLQVAAADAQVAAGTTSAADALSARALRAALAERTILAESDATRARAMLGRWLPHDIERPLAAMPDLDALTAEDTAIEDSVARHRELVPYAARTRVAAAELELARQDKRPDWALEASYGNRGPAYSDMVTVGVRIDLPIFSARRQDPVIAARRAALDEVEAEREAVRREHVAELRAQLAVFEATRARRRQYRDELLPLAADRSDAALAAYRGGSSSLAQSVTALTDRIELEIAAIDRDAELARAWVALHYAFVSED